MILYLLYAIGGFVAVYFLREYRFTFYALALRSVKLLNDILTAEDDDKKLEMLTRSTNKLVASLGKSILLFCLAILAFIIPSSIYTYIISQSLDFTGVGSLYGIIALSVGASIPFFIPTKKSTEEYSELAMLLHRMVLNNYTIGLRLLKREVRQAEKQGLKTDQPFVIVSGLARAGTTSLMNHLMETGEFTSLNYANMPFLLSPNTWSRLYKPAKEQLKERSHKDGLKIGLESNEALEEYFFKAQLNDRFIKGDKLVKHDLSADELNAYLDYQRVIRLKNDTTYLAKNNNFILRYESVRSQNEAFLFIILYRHPLYHAASLLEKHVQYSEMQKDDPFVLEYMDWLGHHEFGLNQKPFEFENNHLVTGDKSTLDYWLRIWINYYRYARGLKHEKTVFISYEAYCSDPNKATSTIFNLLGLSESKKDMKGFNNTREVDYIYDATLLEDAMEIYRSFSR